MMENGTDGKSIQAGLQFAGSESEVETSSIFEQAFMPVVGLRSIESRVRRTRFTLLTLSACVVVRGMTRFRSSFRNMQTKRRSLRWMLVQRQLGGCLKGTY